MIGSDKLLTPLGKLAKQIKADGLSFCALARSRQVFRFAYEAIHQDLRQESLSITVKAIADGRIGVASTNQLDAKSLKQCVQSALAIARHSPRQEKPLPLPARYRLCATDDYDPATAAVAGEACVKKLKHLFRICRGVSAELAGSLVTGEDEMAVINSSGVAAYAASTVCAAKLVSFYRKLSGYASGVCRRFDALDLEAILQRCLKQSLHSDERITPPLGNYEVILEPEAVAELISWLGIIAFGAKSFQERTSFLSGRMGDQILDPQLTIYDDGIEAQGLRMPFDFEGTPKQRVKFIDRGKACGIVYDTEYGAAFDHASTGHGMPADETEGPFPLHLAISPGKESVGSMIRSCKRGLLIPRLHYVNGLLNPREALMTGLTREGTFLIEDGRLKQPVTTLRFTQSLLEALKNVRGISKQRQLIADPSQEPGCQLMPYLHLKQFAFTGHSES